MHVLALVRTLNKTDSHTYSVSGAQERRSGVVNVRQDCRPVGILADVNHTEIVVGDAEINGVSRRCLIDTGAAVSIIPLELIRAATEMTIPASATKLGMISGHTLKVVGPYNAEVRLGSWSAAHRFLVADINTDTILGADFLARHGIDIVFGEGCLRIPTGNWPITVPNATCPPSGPPHETP